jgi:hypothetical protein
MSPATSNSLHLVHFGPALSWISKMTFAKLPVVLKIGHQSGLGVGLYRAQSRRLRVEFQGRRTGRW